MIGVNPDLSDAPPGPPEEVDREHRVFEHGPARGPALIVLGIAVFIIVTGGVASAFLSGSAPTSTIAKVTLTGGTVVALTPATEALHSIVGSGEPPADILGNLAVPAGSTVRGTIDSDRGESQFDRTVSMSIGTLSSSEVVDAFRTLLAKLGWQVAYIGAAARGGAGTEVLAKRGSGDGFYWEVGVVASPTTLAGVTPYSVELFELPDGS